jgi:predicted transcriptional regulator
MTKPKEQSKPSRDHGCGALQIRVARVMSLAGQRQAAIAEALGVTEACITQWKQRHPAFADALNARFDETGKVIESILKRAKGFKKKAIKPIAVKSITEGFDGAILDTKIIDHPIVEYYPPDMTAALAWMKRYDPEWREALSGGKPPPAEGAGQVNIYIDADTLALAGPKPAPGPNVSGC